MLFWTSRTSNREAGGVSLIRNETGTVRRHHSSRRCAAISMDDDQYITSSHGVARLGKGKAVSDLSVTSGSLTAHPSVDAREECLTGIQYVTMIMKAGYSID